MSRARGTPRGLAAPAAATSLPVVLLSLALAARPAGADSPQYALGAATFSQNCAVCHGPAGKGVPGLAPPLTHYPAVYATHPEGRRQLAMTLLFGMFGEVSVEGSKYSFKMTEFQRLNDDVLAEVANFVVFDLGAAAPLPTGAQRVALTPADFTALREPRLGGEQVRAHREALLPKVGL